MKEYIVSQEEKGKRLDTYIPSVDTDILEHLHKD